MREGPDTSQPTTAFDPRVTVVVLTYNRAREIERTLRRLSSLPERPALIVVDNGSQDGTAEAVARTCPEADLIRFSHNIGAAARNAGILLARTPYVALSDDDTWWEEGSLKHAADLLDAYPRVAVLTARVLVGPEEREDPTCLEMAHSPLHPDMHLPGSPILGFLAGASVVRRSALLDVGGFEPRLFIGGEESLVAMDLAAAGWQMVYVHDLIVHHYPSSARDHSRRRRLLLRNAIWIAWLRRPFSSAVKQTLRLVNTHASESPEPTRASMLREALAGLPWIIRRRRVVPQTVEAKIRRLEAA
ncbi:MAG TPA: glycosyltransferase [Nitrospira sp.]|nr:glycosyltransferase [Nitrospira sp.]